MRHLQLKILVAAFPGFFITHFASAAMVSLDANLDPFQEVPPHNTPGYGSADLTLDTTAATLTINTNTGLYNDLLGGATVVRLQDAAVGANGPTLGTFTLDTAGNTSGTFSGSVGSLTAGQIADILAGNTYVNIADGVFPSGEIRGQILTLPEPASIAVVGCVGLMAMRRRRVAL